MAGHQVEVVAGGPHGDREGLSADAHLQRFLGGHVLLAATPQDCFGRAG